MSYDILMFPCELQKKNEKRHYFYSIINITKMCFVNVNANELMER